MRPLICRFLMVGFLVVGCGSSAISEEEFLRDGWPFGWTEASIQELADGLGEPFDDVRVRMLKQEIVDGIIARVEESRPGVFETSIMGQSPYDPPAIHIRGPADDFIHRLIDDAPIGILLVDGLPFPTTTDPDFGAELKRLADKSAEALWTRGYFAWVRGNDGVIWIEVETLPWLPISEEEVLEVVLEVVPAELSDLVEVSVRVYDVPEGADWGPMAVAAWFSDGGYGVYGQLRIDEHCVVVEDQNQGETLIIWPYDLVSWDAPTGSIRWEWNALEPQSGVLTDGDWVSIHGTMYSDYDTLALSDDEPGSVGRKWHWLWVEAPHPDCPKQALLVQPTPTKYDGPRGW